MPSCTIRSPARSKETHNGSLPGGIAPTGTPVHVTGISIERYEGDQIVETRVNWDFLGMMRQVGVIPS